MKTSHRVIEAIATAANVDPLDLRPPLFEVIDPDALDALYDRSGPTLQTQFEYSSFLVTIESDGEVTVEKRKINSDRSAREGV